MLENKRAETLRLLRESGENVSGQDLCEHFGISRTAVWKIMNQLKEEGYEIEAVQNKGYRLLNEPDLMTKDELESRTHTKYVGQTVYYSHEVDSTNTWAKRLAEEASAERYTDNGRDADRWKRPPRKSLEIAGGNFRFDVPPAVPGSRAGQSADADDCDGTCCCAGGTESARRRHEN